MAKKADNMLFKVTDIKDGSEHWYTSLQRIADSIGVQRTTIMQCLWKKNTYKNWKIEHLDGSEVKYKNIN